MKHKTLSATLALLVAFVLVLVVLGFTRSKSQRSADAESLKAQLGGTSAHPGRLGGPAGGNGGPMAQMAAELNLTDAQKAEMQKVMQSSMKVLNGKKDPMAFQAAMEENRKHVEAILTPQQREKMQSMKPPSGSGGMPPMDGPGMPPIGGGR